MSSSTPQQLLATKPSLNYAGEEKDFAIWDANRETLKRLYLTEKCTLEIVKQRMENENGFPIFPLTQYETTLRDRYHFYKNLKAPDWVSIGYHVEKRRLQGKLSYVFLGDKLQEPRKVEKEVRRHNKRAILRDQIRRKCVSPPLRQNISIRTPPPASPPPRQDISISIPRPASQRNRGVMVKILSTAELAIRSEQIVVLRLQSPFNEFISILLNQMMPNSTLATTIDITQRLPTSAMEISPSLGGGSDLALLSQACYILSNQLDSDSRFTMSLLKWIGTSAEIQVLKSFFSINSPTIGAVWDNLYESSIRLEQVQAYDSLVQLDLSMDKRQWITRRSSYLIDAIYLGATNTVNELFKKTAMDPNSLVSIGDIRGLRWDSRLRAYDQLSLFAVAVHSHNLDIMQVLLSHGANVNLSLAQDVGGSVFPPLLAVLYDPQGYYIDGDDDNGSEITRSIDCIRALLDAGLNVDIYEKNEEDEEERETRRWGWSGPGSPLWFIDLMWKHCSTSFGLLAEFSKLSLKMQSEVTVAGIHLAAYQGHENLRWYLASRRLPNGEDRRAILEIALSEASARGLLELVDCLLQLGVDPNVKHISYPSWLSGWNPAFRAAKNQQYHVLRILKDGGCRIHPLLTVKRVLFRCFFYGDLVTNPISLIESLRPEIETDSRSLILQCISQARQQDFLIGAKVCDMVWSWGISLDIGDEGRDALHYAIAHGCCLDMVRFLIARGYRVHSKLAYDYGSYNSSGLSSAANIIGLDSLSHSSMLGDAFISKSSDRLAIIDLLIKEGAGTENVREHYTLLESVLMSSIREYESYRDRKTLDGERNKYNHDTIELFKRFFSAGGPLYRNLQAILSPSYISVLTSLIICEADDTLIFQVIDAFSDNDIHSAEPNMLLAAISKGRLEIARRLLDRGAQVRHPDYAARLTPSLLVARRLLDPEAIYKIYNDYADNSTPLGTACLTEIIPIEFIEDLIKRGAEINPPTTCHHKLSALHVAARAGKLNVASLLLKYGADVNVSYKWVNESFRDSSGNFRTKIYTPLDFTAMEGRLDMVHLLRGLGGKSALPGRTGADGAIDYAREWDHYAIAEFLSSGV